MQSCELLHCTCFSRHESRHMHACRYYNEMALYALDVLQVASLVPYTRRSIVGEMVNSRSGMAILLSAAGGHAYLSDPEVHTNPIASLSLCYFPSFLPSSL